MTTINYTFNDTGPLWVTQFFTTRRAADKHAAWLTTRGGRYVRVTGKRGLWRVRARLPFGDVALSIAQELARKK